MKKTPKIELPIHDSTWTALVDHINDSDELTTKEKKELVAKLKKIGAATLTFDVYDAEES
jgi:hypothetical protein